MCSSDLKDELSRIKNHVINKRVDCKCNIPNVVTVNYVSLNGSSYKAPDDEEEISFITNDYISIGEGRTPYGEYDEDDYHIILGDSKEENDKIWYSMSKIDIDNIVKELKCGEKSNEYVLCDACNNNIRIVEYANMLNLKAAFLKEKSIDIVDSCLVLQKFIRA